MKLSVQSRLKNLLSVTYSQFFPTNYIRAGSRPKTPILSGKTISGTLLNAQFSIQKGFTLVELLVVIVIIAVLATAVILAINPAAKIASSKDAKVKGDLNQYSSAIVAFYTDAGGVAVSAYPTVNTDLTSGTATINGVVTPIPAELKALPLDPAGAAYVYTSKVSSGGAACTNLSVATDCTVASIYGPAYNQGANIYWCWKSSTGTITAVATTAACAP